MGCGAARWARQGLASLGQMVWPMDSMPHSTHPFPPPHLPTLCVPPQVLEDQSVMEALMESRFLSLERLIAFFVM